MSEVTESQGPCGPPQASCGSPGGVAVGPDSTHLPRARIPPRPPPVTFAIFHTSGSMFINCHLHPAGVLYLVKSKTKKDPLKSLKTIQSKVIILENLIQETKLLKVCQGTGQLLHPGPTGRFWGRPASPWHLSCCH